MADILYLLKMLPFLAILSYTMVLYKCYLLVVVVIMVLYVNAAVKYVRNNFNKNIFI